MEIVSMIFYMVINFYMIVIAGENSYCEVQLRLPKSIVKYKQQSITVTIEDTLTNLSHAIFRTNS